MLGARSIARIFRTPRDSGASGLVEACSTLSKYLSKHLFPFHRPLYLYIHKLNLFFIDGSITIPP